MSYHDSTLYWERWLRRIYQRHDGRSRFVQNGYPKKEKDLTREGWREFKGFKRDKAKRYWRRNCPGWLKRQCNKEYRQHQKNLIRHARFEELHTKTRKDYYDAWRWD